MKVIKSLYIELSLFFLCFANLLGAGIPQALLYIILLISICCRLSLPCIAFICVNFLKDINHAFFFLQYQIHGIASFTVLIGFTIMAGFLMRNYTVLFKRGVRLWLVILFCLLSFFAFGNYIHDNSKVATIITTGILSIISFSYLLYNRNHCDFYLMAIYSTIFAVFLMQLNIVSHHYSFLNSLFDFGFYRRAIGTDMYLELTNQSAYATHYQFYGSIVSLSIAFLFATTKVSFPKLIILFFFSLVAIGYTGARQFLGITAVLFSLNMFFTKTNVLIKTVFFSMLVFVGTLVIYNSIMSEYFDIIDDKGVMAGSGRDGSIERGMDLFRSNPVFGVGFGGYSYMGNYKTYPHNLFVEMLAEFGLVGTLVIVSISISTKQSFAYLYNRKYEFKGYYIVLALFLRSMVSLNFAQNIIILSAFLALPFVKLPKINKRIPNTF